MVVGVLALALVGGIAAVAVSENSSGGDGSASFGRGDPVPESLTFEMFDGSTATISDFRGRPVVVNFFASWCPPCVAEMPDFEMVHQEVGDDVLFLGVAQQDRRAAALRLVEQTGVTYPLADDPTGRLFLAFGSFAMPTTVFIDAEGRFVDRHNGIMSPNQLRAAIEQTMSSEAAG